MLKTFLKSTVGLLGKNPAKILSQETLYIRVHLCVAKKNVLICFVALKKYFENIL